MMLILSILSDLEINLPFSVLPNSLNFSIVNNFVFLSPLPAVLLDEWYMFCQCFVNVL